MQPRAIMGSRSNSIQKSSKPPLKGKAPSNQSFGAQNSISAFPQNVRSLSRLSFMQNMDELSPPCVDIGPDPGDISDENIDDYTGGAFGPVSRNNS